MTDANGIEYEVGDEVRYVGEHVSMLSMEARITNVGAEDGKVGIFVPYPPPTWRSQRHRFDAGNFVIVARFDRTEGVYKPLN